MSLATGDLLELEGHALGKVCVVGIGNRLAGDDGAGTAVADRLAGRVAGRVIDAGIAPENHLEPIVRGEPNTILLVDAVDFGAGAGSVRVLDPRAVAPGGLSTHALSLGMVHEYLIHRSKARVVLVGIQPDRLYLGSGLSDEVTRSVEAVARRLVELIGPARATGSGAEAARPAPPVEGSR